MKRLCHSGLLFLLVVVILSIYFIPQQTEALTCDYLSIEEEVEQSDFIFKGKVLRVEEGFVNTRFVFDVQKVWKGNHNIGDELVLDRMFFYFNEGEEYIVFAKDVSVNNYYISPCGNTNESSLSLEWELGIPSQGMHILTPWLISIGGLGILTFIYFKKRKYKKP